MEKISGINLEEQVLYYHVQNPEGSVYGRELSISPVATDVATDIQRLYQSQNEDEVVKAQNRLSRFFKENRAVKQTGVKNFSDLQTFLSEGDTSRISQDTEDRLKNLNYDLIDGVTLATLGNVKNGDSELKEAIVNNDDEAVERIYRLPPEMKGLGKVIVETAITHTRTIREIKLLQSYINSGGASFKDFQRTLGNLERVYMDETDERYLPQIQMVLAYLRSMVEGMEAGQGVENEKQEQAKEDKKRKLEEEQKNKDNIHNQLQFARLMWNQSRTEGMPIDIIGADWSATKDRLWVRKVADLAKAGAGKSANMGGDIKQLVGMEPRGEGVFTATNREMEMLMETAGVKQCIDYMMKTFFEPGMENGVYVLNLKDNDQTREYYNDKDLLLRDVVNRLTSGDWAVFTSVNRVKNEAEAAMAAAIAYNLLSVGHVWESAGKGVTTTFSSDSLVEFMFPEKKAIDKNKKLQAWGGKINSWLENIRSQANQGNVECANFCNRWESGLIHVYPPRLFNSFIEGEKVKVLEEGGLRREISMAQALYEGKKIDFANSGENGYSSNLWSHYLGQAGAASKLFEIITDKVALTLKSEDMVKWRADMDKSINKLSDNNLLNRHLKKEFVRWAIAESTSGIMNLNTPDTIFNWGAEKLSIGTFIDIVTSDMVKSGVLNDEDVRFIKNSFAANNPLARGWRKWFG